MSALKTSLYTAQKFQSSYSKDTREEDGERLQGVNVGLLERKGVKVAILDSDF